VEEPEQLIHSSPHKRRLWISRRAARVGVTRAGPARAGRPASVVAVAGMKTTCRRVVAAHFTTLGHGLVLPLSAALPMVCSWRDHRPRRHRASYLSLRPFHNHSDNASPLTNR
jgi:hypothetical protein